jgi:metal-sulfur cluster biosynthetic enzyme
MELKDQIIVEIKKIYDPEIPVNIYELGLIYDIKVENKNTAKVIVQTHRSTNAAVKAREMCQSY